MKITAAEYNTIQSMSDDECKAKLRENRFHPQQSAQWNSQEPSLDGWFKTEGNLVYSNGSPIPIETTRDRWIDLNENLIIGEDGVIISGEKFTLKATARLTAWQTIWAIARKR